VSHAQPNDKFQMTDGKCPGEFMAEKEYDVLIVGPGASGGMAAYILTQRGLKCLLLEAGPGIDFQRQRGLKSVYELPYRGFGKPGRLPHVFQASEFNANQWVDEGQVPSALARRASNGRSDHCPECGGARDHARQEDRPGQWRQFR
jgi:choline dehydrogenase-like flavoprotein